MSMGLLIFTGVILLIIAFNPILINFYALKSSDTKEQVKKSLTTIGIINLFSILIIVGLWISPIKNNDFTSNNKKNDNEIDTSITLEKSNFTELSIDEYLDLIKKDEKSLILVARPTCGYCQKFTPILSSVQKQMDLKVYYINTDNFDENSWNKFSSSFSYLSTEQWGTPLLLVVQKNEIVDLNNGYVEVDALKEFLEKNGFGK